MIAQRRKYPTVSHDWLENNSRLMYTLKYPEICPKTDEGFSVKKSKIWHLWGEKSLCGRLEIIKDGGWIKNLQLR